MKHTTLPIERLIEMRRLEHAQRLLAEALAALPEDPELEVLAVRLDMERQRDAASILADLDALLARAPELEAARILRVHVLLRLERTAEAERDLIDLIQASPEDPEALGMYGALMAETLHLERARTLLSEALRCDPTDLRARFYDILVGLAMGERERAESALRAFIAEDPDGPLQAATLVHILSVMGRYREARDVAQRLLQRFPEDRSLLEMNVSLRAMTHWTAWPRWPVERWGPPFQLILFGLFVLVPVGAVWGWYSPGVMMALWLAWALYMAYGWAQPPLMRAWLRARGW